MTGEQAPDRGDEDVLREKVRQAVRAGTLPDRRPVRTWGGSGVGADCPICATPVKYDELEFEIEFAPNGDSPRMDTYHLHVRCFQAWQLERNYGLPPQILPARGRPEP